MNDRLLPSSERSASKQSAHERPQGERKWWIAMLNAPLTIMLLGIILANFVLAGYQDRAFRKNELFKARLQRIFEAQRDVIRIRADVEMAFRALRSQEDFNAMRLAQAQPAEKAALRVQLAEQLKRSPGADALRRSKIELAALADSIGTGRSQSIGSATENYTKRLALFLTCVNGDSSAESRCADQYGDLVGLAQKVVGTYSERADEYLREQR